MFNTKARSNANNLNSTKSLGPRKKKPVEQPVLSEHIPGYKGEQEVDWLVNFIESGASNQQTNKKSTSTNNTNNSKKTKPQPKKSVQIENERDIQQSRKSSNVTNNNNNNSISIAISKPTPSSQQRPMQNIQNKQISSSQQTNQLSERKSQQTILNNQKETNHQVTNNNINNKLIRSSRVYKESNVSHSANKSSVKPIPNKHIQESSQLPKDKFYTAVTFADHIRIGDDDETAQYTFGFFDEQKPKLMKSSPISDQRRYKLNDNIDANSFNYKQILEFISKSWKQTMAVNMTKTAS